MDKKELCQRWASIIRGKAFEYEVPERKNWNGENISQPDLLTIANEIEAFFVGFNNK